jgi:ribosomal protein S18 acetylase RimI-like enzyme
MRQAVKIQEKPDLESPQIRVASEDEMDALIATLLLAFSADPPTRWFFREPRQLVHHYPAFVRAFAGAAFTNGGAFTIDGYAGAALWLPPGIESDGATVVALVKELVPQSGHRDAFGVLEEMGRYHPHEPHWYLPLIGVDPAQHRNGYGSALLRHTLAICDREHLPAYLEASKPSSIPLYERHGFVVRGTVQVGDSPPITPMWRDAR